MNARSVVVCDVGPRDGLQNEPRALEPATRASLVDRLAAAGLRRVEAASFVNPARVPQMAGAEEVAAAIRRLPGVVYSGLVLNERGYDRLSTTSLDEVHYSVFASETFSRRNSNATVDEALGLAAGLVERAHADGRRAVLAIGVAFGCPFEGSVDAGRVVALAERLVASGADEIVLGDTIGACVPSQASALVSALVPLGRAVGIHLHNTRQTASACAYAALEAGATIFDGSVGGIGGCPFAPRASGNIATEDLVYLLEREGVETGIDLDALIAVAAWLEDLLEHELPGGVHRAGPFPPPVPVAAE